MTIKLHHIAPLLALEAIAAAIKRRTLPQPAKHGLG